MQENKTKNPDTLYRRLIDLTKQEHNRLLEVGVTDSVPLLEILFTQRTVMEGHRHSGQICFPGGGLDFGETDFDGAVREVKEEIGLDLSPSHSIYLGKLPFNLFTYLKRGKKTYISNLAFLSLGNIMDTTSELKINPTEVSSFSVPNDEVEDAW